MQTQISALQLPEGADILTEIMHPHGHGRLRVQEDTVMTTEKGTPPSDTKPTLWANLKNKPYKLTSPTK